jgi:hypothetical protein
MSTVGTIAISILVGMFILAALGLAAWLVYLLIVFRRDTAAIRTSFQSILTTLDASISTRLSEMDDIITKFGTILETHRTETQHAIASINGQELSQAVKLFSALTQEQRSSASRIERAAVAIGTFTKEWLSQEAIGQVGDNGDGLVPPAITGIGLDGYAVAQPGERYVGQSRTAADDASVLAEESGEVTQG